MPAGAELSFATLHGLYWLLVNLAERGPLVVSVDDLHWVDEPSLRFLTFVHARLEGLPVLLVVATRPLEQLDPMPSTLATLLSAPETERAVRAWKAAHRCGPYLDARGTPGASADPCQEEAVGGARSCPPAVARRARGAVKPCPAGRCASPDGPGLDGPTRRAQARP